MHVLSVMLDADKGNHVHPVGTVGWTHLQVFRSVKVRALLAAFGSLADSAVGYYIELALHRLHRFPGVSRHAL